MAHPRIVFLMYHELEIPGRELYQSDAGYVRYILRIEIFRAQMEWLRQSGFQGLSVSEAIAFPNAPGICITFDDGCETDLIAAAPILKELRLNATFYVTAGNLDRKGCLTSEQLRELDSQGFEIGCHSMTHRYLSDLAEDDLRHEVVDAKDRLEQILGRPIHHFSCPGGRYGKSALEMARRAGFKTVANSEFHANTPKTDPYQLGRVAMLRDLSLGAFRDICHGRGLWKKWFAQRTRFRAQQLLGNRTYDRMRAALLGESGE